MHRCIYLKFGGFPSQEIPGAGGGRKIAGTRLESTATSEQVVARSFALIEVCTLRPIFVMDLHFSLCLLLSLREGWLGACCRCCVVLLCSVAILAQVVCWPYPPHQHASQEVGHTPHTNMHRHNQGGRFLQRRALGVWVVPRHGRLAGRPKIRRAGRPT